MKIDRDTVELFLNKVFNYYNGKINIVNCPAVLKIEWALLYNRSEAGYTKDPNIVTVNPMIIMRNCNTETDFYILALETVIHELYHIDQVIDYFKLVSDPSYRIKIEQAVEIMTANYLINHSDDIALNFGLYVYDPAHYEAVIRVWGNYDSWHYDRLKYYDHIFSLINLPLRMAGYSDDTMKNLYSIIKTSTETNNGKILFNINNEPIVVQNNDMKVSITDINKYFYFKYRNCTAYSITDASIINDGLLYIAFNIIPYYKMTVDV